MYNVSQSSANNSPTASLPVCTSTISSDNWLWLRRVTSHNMLHSFCNTVIEVLSYLLLINIKIIIEMNNRSRLNKPQNVCQKKNWRQFLSLKNNCRHNQLRIQLKMQNYLCCNHRARSLFLQTW